MSLMQRDWIDRRREMVDARLAELLTPEGVEPRGREELLHAMRYVLLARGKRIRPLLAMAVAEHFGAPAEHTLDVGCAIEMIHASSLVYDDLPCMDDDDMRRDMPACHVRFGEATAILAAIALNNRAYEIIADAEALPCETRLELMRQMSGAMGIHGLAGGQFVDLTAGAESLNLVEMAQMHFLKTGVLFRLAAQAGARAANLTGEALAQVTDYAQHLGLTFQALDDLSDGDGIAANHTLRDEIEHTLRTHQRKTEYFTRQQPQSPLQIFATAFIDNGRQSQAA